MVGRVQLNRSRVGSGSSPKVRASVAAQALDPRDVRGREPAGQPSRGGRGRRVGDHAQLGARHVRPQPVKVAQEVPAGQQRLGHRHHQLPAGQPTVTLLDRTDPAVKLIEQTGGGDRLGHRHQPGRSRQRHIVATDVDRLAPAR